MSTSHQQMALPLDLDEPSEPQLSREEGLQGIVWSHSRRDMLERCPLQYYLNYFGASKRAARLGYASDELILLKAATNRYLRTGDILHLVVRKYFRDAQSNRSSSLGNLISWARRIFQEDLSYSRQYPHLPTINVTYPPILLREFIYQQHEAESLCLEAEERMVQAITSFYKGPLFDEFRSGGRNKQAIIEHSFYLKGLPCQVMGKIDLAYDTGTSVTVVDWKIGVGDNHGEDSLQLCAYALWALDHFDYDPAHLRICKAHLTSTEIHEFSASLEVLADARIRIIQDAERIAAVQKYGREGIVEAFTPRLVSNICKMCAFEGVCYDRN